MARIQEIRQYRIELSHEEMTLLRAKLALAVERERSGMDAQDRALYQAFRVETPHPRSVPEQEEQEYDGPEEQETIVDRALRVAGGTQTARSGTRRKSRLTASE